MEEKVKKLTIDTHYQTLIIESESGKKFMCNELVPIE